jgi:hypothetical protein
MMAKLSLITLLSTLFFIQSAVALPWKGWFKSFSNDTAPAYPTGPTGTGTGLPYPFPTAYMEKEKRFFPFPTATGIPFPTGTAPTGFPTGWWKRGEVEKREAKAEAVEAVEAEIKERRFEGARKEKRFWFAWGDKPSYPAPTGASSGFAMPTGTGYATGTGGPTAYPTAYYMA